MNDEMISNVDNIADRTIYKNLYGEFIVIGMHWQYALIKFINLNDFNFNTIKYINKANIITGDISSVIDPYKFTSYNNSACLGMPELLGYRTISENPLYSRWVDMIKRCYVPTCKEFANYGAIGVKTIYWWRCYEYFLRDAICLPNYNEFINNPKDYSFDKDFLQMNIPDNQKIYSPQTCMFVEKSYNCAERNFRAAKKSGINYVGVKQRSSDGLFIAFVDRIIIGVYKDPEAAAYAYNLYKLRNDPNYPRQLLNPVPELSKEELFSRKVTRSGK